MKDLNLVIKLDLENIIKIPGVDILLVSVRGIELGYVRIERDSDGDEISVMPFTAQGEMDEVHCMGCAIKSLMAQYSGFAVEDIDVGEIKSLQSSFTGLLDAAFKSPVGIH